LRHSDFAIVIGRVNAFKPIGFTNWGAKKVDFPWPLHQKILSMQRIWLGISKIPTVPSSFDRIAPFADCIELSKPKAH
jgi:hypothetical protein